MVERDPARHVRLRITREIGRNRAGATMRGMPDACLETMPAVARLLARGIGR